MILQRETFQIAVLSEIEDFLNDCAPIFPAAGAELDEVVGGGDDVGVVLDDEDGVAKKSGISGGLQRHGSEKCCDALLTP